MRQILFRGKRKDNGEWVYGLITSLDPDCINGVEVFSETRGQYTGLSAEESYRGTKPEDLMISEGDIVKDENGVIWEIGCHDGIYIKAHRTGRDKIGSSIFLAGWLERSEIIGNIHDRKE
jgi:hypothetical protein